MRAAKCFAVSLSSPEGACRPHRECHTQDSEIKNAEQRVAATNARVQEAERLARSIVSIHGATSSADRHRIAVDAVDAAARDLAQSVAAYPAPMRRRLPDARAPRARPMRRAAASRK